MPAQKPINSDDAEVQGAVAVKYAPLAQQVEHRPFKAGVPSSSLGRGTISGISVEVTYQPSKLRSPVRSRHAGPSIDW